MLIIRQIDSSNVLSFLLFPVAADLDLIHKLTFLTQKHIVRGTVVAKCHPPLTVP